MILMPGPLLCLSYRVWALYPSLVKERFSSGGPLRSLQRTITAIFLAVSCCSAGIRIVWGVVSTTDRRSAVQLLLGVKMLLIEDGNPNRPL